MRDLYSWIKPNSWFNLRIKTNVKPTIRGFPENIIMRNQNQSLYSRMKPNLGLTEEYKTRINQTFSFTQIIKLELIQLWFLYIIFSVKPTFF